MSTELHGHYKAGFIGNNPLQPVRGWGYMWAVAYRVRNEWQLVPYLHYTRSDLIRAHDYHLIRKRDRWEAARRRGEVKAVKVRVFLEPPLQHTQ